MSGPEPQPQAVTVATAVIAAVRDQLAARYGWTHVEVTPELTQAPGCEPRLRVRGSIAVPRIAARIEAALAEALPGVALELALGPMPVLAWHALAGELAELWAEHPRHRPDHGAGHGAGPALASELLADDGPVGLLAEAEGARLVRARDGTVGWLLAPLGPATDPRPLPEPRLPDDPGAALVSAALAYRGVRYQLGGTTAARIDCSGLVARAFAAALGLVLPRNSNDQLALTGGGELLERFDGGGGRGAAGDLVFLRSRRMGRTHVGLLTGAGTVIHASRTRDAVIVEPGEAIEADAEWLRLVRWPALVAWARAQAGRPSLPLPDRA